MKRLVYLVLLCISAGNLLSQNLVLNPSFEEYHECPKNEEDKAFPAKFWNRLHTYGTSDYFVSNYNGCIVGNEYGSVPNNLFGYAKAKTGSAYSGIIPIDENLYQEHLIGHLSQKLIKGGKYRVSFYVYRADASAFSVKLLGAYLSRDSIQPSIISSPNYDLIKNYKTQIQANHFLDSVGWLKIEGIYQAAGGEEFITIGFFGQIESTIEPYILDKFLSGKLKGRLSCKVKKYLLKPNKKFDKKNHPFEEYGKKALFPYYYIDDVSVVRVE